MEQRPTTVGNNEYGYVYVLKNQWMENLVKIGKTTNIKKRMDDLYNTSVPAAFRALYVSKLPIDKMDDTERTLHLVFSDDRVNPKREFFQLGDEKIDKAIRILKLVETENVTDEVNGTVKTSLPPEEEKAWEENSEMVRRARRPNIDFFLLGLNSGENLYWKDDNSVCVTICSARKVLYNGKECYLTAATKEVLGTTAPIAPAPYWRYNGRLLADIYNDFYSNPSDGEE
ncbi:MAG: GIY-YIG nuclease family protein [Prevotella sp.]|nr:GIY-YIG nuclease family protein [Prevotella sp.]